MLLAAWNGFQPPVRYPSTAGQALLVRDLDGDGAPDIVASGNQVEELPSFSLLRNRGDGTFEPEQFIASDLGEHVEDVADLNGDGIPDLVASNYWSNGISVHLGKGAGQFAAGVAHTTATHGGPSLILDYDRDGLPDIVSFSFGSGNPVRVHLFRGNGDGTLAPKMTFDTDVANAVWPSVRRVSGALEVLADERFGDLVLYRVAEGTVTFTRIAAGPGIDLSNTFADLNGDGIADIVDTAEGGAISVSLGNEDGTFAARKVVAQLQVEIPVQVRSADFDGDGHADLIVADFRHPALYYVRGDGAGGFADPVPIDAGGPVNVFDIADVNGDGCPDIVTANEDRSVSVVLNRGPCRPSRRRAVR